MYESPRVKLDIHAYLHGNILNFKVDSLSLLFNRTSVIFLTIQSYPELQRKTLWTLCAFLLSNIHSFLSWLTISYMYLASPTLQSDHHTEGVFGPP